MGSNWVMKNKITNAGISTCPICKRKWLVTPFDDCLMPNCGCFGFDTGPDNPNRLCENCGLLHSFNCKKLDENNQTTKQWGVIEI